MVDTTAQLLSPEERIVRVLQNMPYVQRIWLFGSRARHDNRERSDIDIAVEAPEADVLAWDQIEQTVDQAETLLPIDLVRFYDAPTALKSRILKQGKLLHDVASARS